VLKFWVQYVKKTAFLGIFLYTKLVKKNAHFSVGKMSDFLVVFRDRFFVCFSVDFLLTFF